MLFIIFCNVFLIKVREPISLGILINNDIPRLTTNKYNILFISACLSVGNDVDIKKLESCQQSLVDIKEPIFNIDGYNIYNIFILYLSFIGHNN